jgi:hypothetical protein
VSEHRPVDDPDDINRAGVDLDRAIQCVELSQLSYRPPSLARELALGRHGYRAFDSAHQRDGRDYLLMVDDGETRIVAVRGTDDLRDWLTNLKVWYRSSPVGRVHAGYYGASIGFLEPLRGALGGGRVVLTGHSMGGAIATLLAGMLVREGVCIEGLYTFGQPLVGLRDFNDQFRTHCRFPYFRFVHGADAFATWTLGDEGAPGTRCYFDLKGRISFSRQLTHVPRLSLRFHRLEEYRYLLRLNRLRLRALAETDDATVVKSRDAVPGKGVRPP